MNRPTWIGQTLGGRYRIDEIVGQGGMSAVYKAFDPNLKRVVAVKMIHAHLADDPKFLVRFEEEAAAVAQLRHPNIVQVFDFNLDNDLYYMVQEFIPGETLQDRLRRLNKTGRRMPIAEALGYIINISDAAGYAHKRGLIHRDIKPANIMLDIHNQAILMDFGIVKMTGGEKHTATGAVVGTALYLPPELIRGETPDPRSDLYSLGVTLFEIVSGKPPYEAESAMTLMMMHLNDPLPDLRNQRPDVPFELSAVIEKALAKDRNQRYASMDDFAAALQIVLNSLPGTAPQPTIAEETPAVPSSRQEVGRISAPAKAPSPNTPEHDTYQAVQTTSPSADVTLTPEGKSLLPAAQPQVPEITKNTLPAARPTDSSTNTPAAANYPGISTSDGSPPASSSFGKYLARPWVWIAAVLALGIFGIGLAAGGNLLRANPNSTDGTATANAALALSTQAVPNVAVVASPSDTPTFAPSATATIPPPTDTPSPTLPPNPAFSPSPTIPAGIPYARINAISIDTQGQYVVEYETFEFTEQLPGQHVHFFFNTIPPEQAGMPGSGPWELYGGPRPFKRYTTTDRPAEATHMCILVANADHSVQPESGTCYPLPDVYPPQAIDDSPLAVLERARQWQVKLQDSFDANDFAWNTGLSEDNDLGAISRAIAYGRYLWDIQAQQPAIWWAIPEQEEQADFYLATTVRQIQGPDTGEYGVIFRKDINAYYYVFKISQNGKYALFYNSQNGWEKLIDWSETSLVKPGEDNRMEVVARGSTINLYLNGESLAQISDDNLGSGQAGVFVGLSGANESGAWEFDDFELRQAP